MWLKQFILLAGGFVTSLPVGPLSRYLVLLLLMRSSVNSCRLGGPHVCGCRARAWANQLPWRVQVCDQRSAHDWLENRREWLCEHSASGTPGRLLAFPRLTRGWGQFRQYGAVWSCTAGGRECHRARFPLDSLWGSARWLLFWRENSSPPYLTSQLRNGSGAFTPTTGEWTHPKQGCNNHRGKRRACCTCSTGSGHRNTNHTTYQGDIVQHLRNTWQASIL